jgi:peptidoglycan hydrolase-like protein with peptidoglycan-binding domain
MRPVALAATLLAALAVAPTPGHAEARNPFAVAVIIGNKTYQNHDIPEVKYADRDAEAIRRYAIDVLGYDEQNIIFLQNASQGAMLKVFGSADDPKGQLARWLRPGGKSDVLVYYSGHGVPSVKDAQSYLLPVDADPNAVSQNGYPLNLLYANLQKLGAHSVTVLLDACFSGASAEGPLISGASVLTRPASAAPAAAQAGGLTVLAASQADQVANWDGKHRHGLFTEYFLEAVYGRANDPQYGGTGNGRITLGAVQKYLDQEMSYVAEREDGRDQNATVSGDPGMVLAALTPDAPPHRLDETPSTPAAAPPPAPAPQAAPAPPAPPPPAPAAATPAPAATPSAAEDALALSAGDRVLVQQWLGALGYPTGGTDGAFGPATRAAIAAYQRVVGAPASGYLTSDLFVRLRRDGQPRLDAARSPAPRSAPAQSATVAPPPAPVPAPAAPPPPQDMQHFLAGTWHSQRQIDLGFADIYAVLNLDGSYSRQTTLRMANGNSVVITVRGRWSAQPAGGNAVAINDTPLFWTPRAVCSAPLRCQALSFVQRTETFSIINHNTLGTPAGTQAFRVSQAAR